MSDRFEVKQGERGLVRLFTVDLPPDRIDALRTPDLARALGVETLDADQIDLFSTDDVKELGLTGYMTEGLGIPEADLAADRAQLDALTGTVLIVRSAAFGGQAARVTVRAPLHWVATYAEDHAPVKFDPLPSGGPADTANARQPAKRVSNAAMSGRVAMVALVVLAVLTAVMVWVASS